METKTVVLDGYTLNPGDLSWEPLTDLGRCEIYERTAAHETHHPRQGGRSLADQQGGARPGNHRASCPTCVTSASWPRASTSVDLAAARERGIVVTNVPAYSTPSVVQLTFALLLELTHRVGHHAGSVRAGNWVKSKDFAYWDFPLVELAGLKMGLIGFGAIAQGVAKVPRRRSA